MNRRKADFKKGLRALSKRRLTLAVIRPSLYNRDGMPETNQIICGDSIKTLNEGPEGWIDLVFANPPSTSVTSITATTTVAKPRII